MSNRDVMAAVHEKYYDAVSRKDTIGIAALYTEKARMYTKGGFIMGRTAIRDNYQKMFDSGVTDVKLEVLELEEHGDVAFELGKYVIFGVEARILDRGKYALVWKREDGEWKYHIDIGISEGRV